MWYSNVNLLQLLPVIRPLAKLCADATDAYYISISKDEEAIAKAKKANPKKYR